MTQDKNYNSVSLSKLIDGGGKTHSSSLADESETVSTIDSGTLGSLTGGTGEPGTQTFTVSGVTSDQQAKIGTVVVYVDTDPSFNADYRFNYEWGHRWDDTNQQIDVEINVHWDLDPGSGNDVSLSYAVTSGPGGGAAVGSSSLTTLGSGNITLTGGSVPAYNGSLGESLGQTDQINVVSVTPRDPSWNGDYGYSFEWWQTWDDSATSKDVNLQVDWQTDPGSGNDLTVDYEVLQ